MLFKIISFSPKVEIFNLIQCRGNTNSSFIRAHTILEFNIKDTIGTLEYDTIDSYKEWERRRGWLNATGVYMQGLRNLQYETHVCVGILLPTNMILYGIRVTQTSTITCGIYRWSVNIRRRMINLHIWYYSICWHTSILYIDKNMFSHLQNHSLTLNCQSCLQNNYVK